MPRRAREDKPEAEAAGAGAQGAQGAGTPAGGAPAGYTKKAWKLKKYVRTDDEIQIEQQEYSTLEFSTKKAYPRRPKAKPGQQQQFVFVDLSPKKKKQQADTALTGPQGELQGELQGARTHLVDGHAAQRVHELRHSDGFDQLRHSDQRDNPYLKLSAEDLMPVVPLAQPQPQKKHGSRMTRLFRLGSSSSQPSPAQHSPAQTELSPPIVLQSAQPAQPPAPQQPPGPQDSGSGSNPILKRSYSTIVNNQRNPNACCATDPLARERSNSTASIVMMVAENGRAVLQPQLSNTSSVDYTRRSPSPKRSESPLQPPLFKTYSETSIPKHHGQQLDSTNLSDCGFEDQNHYLDTQNTKHSLYINTGPVNGGATTSQYDADDDGDSNNFDDGDDSSNESDALKAFTKAVTLKRYRKRANTSSSVNSAVSNMSPVVSSSLSRNQSVTSISSLQYSKPRVSPARTLPPSNLYKSSSSTTTPTLAHSNDTSIMSFFDENKNSVKRSFHRQQPSITDGLTQLGPPLEDFNSSDNESESPYTNNEFMSSQHNILASTDYFSSVATKNDDMADVTNDSTITAQTYRDNTTSSSYNNNMANAMDSFFSEQLSNFHHQELVFNSDGNPNNSAAGNTNNPFFDFTSFINYENGH